MPKKHIPSVSVLMPAYNAQDYISEAIESILNQSFKDFELIIADDHSTDKTRAIINRYAKKDTRIKVYFNKQNLYIAGNRNLLLKKASGKYIAWQDADDISYPNRLTLQFNYLEKHPRVGIVGGYLVFFNEQGVESIRKYHQTDSELRKNIFLFSPVAQPGAMIRKEAIDFAGEYNIKYPPAEDIDMSFRIGQKFEFANIQSPVIRYRENVNSATFNRLKTIELNTIKIRLTYALGHGYHITFLDFLYNLLQFISIYVIPPRLKIKLFNIFRNSRNLNYD